VKVLLSWLREFAASPGEGAADGPAVAAALARVGLAAERLEGDTLELELAANRPDCLSHYGVARELAAALGLELTPAPQGAPLAPGHGAGAIHIDAPEACPHYCALALDDVAHLRTPPEAAARLHALGHRSINPLADLTNYALFEMGHPTHAFDADTLRGGELRVRWARAGERLTTLDGVERALAADDLVIADAERPVALAGVMGGLETAITADTRRAVIESAWFDPAAVRRAARRHNLHTDASHRFERGADPQGPRQAARLLAARARAGGAQVAGFTERGGAAAPAAPIPLRASEIERMLGIRIEETERARILVGLGCTPSGGAWQPPSWRADLRREIDLIEELARVAGFDCIPAALPAFAGAGTPLPEAALRDRVRRQLLGRGFYEALAMSFDDAAACRRFTPEATPVELLNPLSEEAAILRTSSLPAMLRMLQHNLRHGVAAPRLYEIAKVYRLEQARPHERATLSLGAAEAALDLRAWKGDVEAVLHAFALPPLAAQAATAGWLAEGRGVRLGAAAVCGQLHPAIAAEWKLPAHVWLAEIDLEPLYALGPRAAAYREPSRFPASERDFSFLFADGVTWAALAAALRTPAIAHLAALEPLDVYRGRGVVAGHYSLLLRARFQSDERTLRDEEVQAGADEIVRRLIALGGAQR
jgi:phenylalanyl-tRNA synthetase beta chain